MRLKPEYKEELELRILEIEKEAAEYKRKYWKQMYENAQEVAQ